jgi:catechol 2,3-dioxygenase-like lactoylglutathione lyase family enzyme
MAQARIEGVAPFLIVGQVSASIAFYRDRLGFDVGYAEPGDDPFFAIVARNGASLFLKHVGVPALPNPVREGSAKWDAYFYVPDPDALAAEYADRGAPFRTPLGVTSERLRGFEIADPDGYVLFFGRPD